MKSMTGFGTGESSLGPGKLVLDARSVNHRYLDVRIRLPEAFADQALFLEQRAREKLIRGRYDLGVRYEGPALAARLDTERAKSLYRDLEKLRDELSPGADVPFTALLSVPALFATGPGFGLDEMQGALGRAFDGAVANLDEMRAREGRVLKGEIATPSANGSRKPPKPF
jgi:uncharacterized protein (TIGR00255 family)